MEIRAANLGSKPALSVKNFEEIFNGEVSPSVAKGKNGAIENRK